MCPEMGDHKVFTEETSHPTYIGGVFLYCKRSALFLFIQPPSIPCCPDYLFHQLCKYWRLLCGIELNKNLIILLPGEREKNFTNDMHFDPNKLCTFLSRYYFVISHYSVTL